MSQRVDVIWDGYRLVAKSIENSYGGSYEITTIPTSISMDPTILTMQREIDELKKDRELLMKLLRWKNIDTPEGDHNANATK